MGSITSRSGLNDCSAGQTCEVVIERGSSFSDTFSAEPDDGYYFRGWASGRGYLCAGSVLPCALEGVPGEFTDNAAEAFLQPEFAPDNISQEHRNSITVVYAIPRDMEFRSDYALAIEAAVVDVQTWFRHQLAGKTISLVSTSPVLCRLPSDSRHYLEDTVQRVWEDLQDCLGPQYHEEFLSIVFADVIHGCSEDRFWRDKGAAGSSSQGFAMLTRPWLERLAGASSPSSACQGSPPPAIYAADNSPIGVLGHEIGHMLDLLHPLACVEGEGSCDWRALMFSGWAAYPDTHLRQDEIARLFQHPAIQ